MARVLPAWLALALALTPTGRAHGQAAPDPGQELRLIESTERDEDPLGIDPSTGTALDEAAARLPKAAPSVSRLTASQGPALSSIEGVGERGHRTTVRLEDGLAFVTTEATLGSRAKHAAEVAYRLPLPVGAVVTRVRACRGRDAWVEAAPRSIAAPAVPPASPARALGLEAVPIVDALGDALALRVAPIVPGAEVTLAVSYVAPAPLRGGRVRLSMPARGYDPRLAPSEVSIEAPGLAALAPAPALRLDPWSPLEITAARPARPPRSVRETRASCDGGVCVRRYEAAALTRPDARATWLLIDASPSMEGPARGRAEAAIGTLVSTLLPEETPLRAFAFAAEARDLGRFRAGDAPLRELVDATLHPLGAATQPGRALALARDEIARVRPRIVIVSDGAIDASDAQQRALREARSRGATLWLVHVGDAAPRLVPLFAGSGGVLDVAREADLAARDGTLEPLADGLRAVTQATAAGGLRGGEERVHERPAQRARPTRAGAPWLAHWLARTAPALAWSALMPQDGEVVAAMPYLSRARPAQPVTALPKETVLSLLRTQLVPRARACLRVDRKGRGDYAVELTFHGLFADREVYEGRVEGAIPAPLRACLEDVLATLRIPAFSGRVRVRYPIHTEREAPVPVIELEPEVARTLERAFGAPRELR